MDTSPQEIELKLALRPAQMEAAAHLLMERLGPPQEEKRPFSQYYDTADYSLRHARAALRLRRQDGWMQTLKAGGGVKHGVHARGEWNWPLAAPEPDEALLQETPVADLLAGTPLQAIFVTEFRRRIWNLQWQGAEIELALDDGQVSTASAQIPIAEIELELKGGDPQALLPQAQALIAGIPCWVNTQTKAALGYALVQGKTFTQTDPPAGADAWLHALCLFLGSHAHGRLYARAGSQQEYQHLLQVGQELVPGQVDAFRAEMQAVAAGSWPEALIASTFASRIGLAIALGLQQGQLP